MENWIEIKLKNSGYKITEPRKQVVDWLLAKKGIFSAGEILKALELDKVSVYRTLELLSDMDIIHSTINVHGEQHYELHEEDHHHHAVCTECEKTECVPCNLKNNTVNGFVNIHHSFSLTGMCTSCAS